MPKLAEGRDLVVNAQGQSPAPHQLFQPIFALVDKQESYQLHIIGKHPIILGPINPPKPFLKNQFF